MTNKSNIEEMSIMEDSRYKFRVFYKGNYTYFNFNTLNDESRDFYLNEIKDNTIEQCTSLKDKNGDLIYEGDIILYDCNIGRDYEDKLVTIKGIVKYKDQMFVIDDEIDFEAPLNSDIFEIIGNTHTNKEKDDE